MSTASSPDPTALPTRARALADARRWVELVELLSPLANEALRAQPEVAVLLADGVRRVGQADRAVQIAALVEPEVRRLGNRRLLLDLVNIVGMAAFEAGDAAAAEQRFGELLERATSWGDEEFAARASNNLGVLANVRGRHDLALTYYQRALAAYQRLGYTRGLAQTHHNLGISYRDLQRDREADANFRRAMELARGAQSEDVVALAETERAMLCVRAGDAQLAQALAMRAFERHERLGDPLGRAEAIRVLAAAARASGDFATALSRLDEALEVARSHSDPLLRAEVQRDRGELLLDRGDLSAARAALLDAAHHFDTLGAERDAAAARARLGTAEPAS